MDFQLFNYFQFLQKPRQFKAKGLVFLTAKELVMHIKC